MIFHKASEERKWKQWKEQEERILRESGVSEGVIQRLRELDWQDFNTERRYWEHFHQIRKSYIPKSWKSNLRWHSQSNSYLTAWKMNNCCRFFWNRIKKPCRSYCSSCGDFLSGRLQSRQVSRKRRFTHEWIV